MFTIDKDTKFEIPLLLVGCTLLVFGIASRIQFYSVDIAITTFIGQFLSMLFGTILIFIAITLHFRLNNISFKNLLRSGLFNPKRSRTRELTATDFFYTISSRPDGDFESITKGTKRVRILCRTAVNLVNSSQNVLRKLCQAGCTIDILFVDPTSESTKYIYGQKRDLFNQNYLLSTTHLQKLKHEFSSNINLRTTSHAPTQSLIIVEHDNSKNNFVQVQLYFLHSSHGSDRPIFRVLSGEILYTIFVDEFDELWKNASVWSSEKSNSIRLDRNDRIINTFKMDGCPFCNESISDSIYLESDKFKAVYNIAPILPGHSLIVPKWHCTSLSSLTIDELVEMVDLSRKAERVLSRAFTSTGFNWTIQEGSDAGQTVRHLHLHLIPRTPEDLPHPGDWYPRLREHDEQLLDSSTRPRHNEQEVKAIVSRLRNLS